MVQTSSMQDRSVPAGGSEMEGDDDGASASDVEDGKTRKEHVSLPATTGRQGAKTLTSFDFGDAEFAPPPTKRDRAVLVRIDSIEAGRLFAMEGPELRLGRMPGNHIVIDDSGISRDHARLYRDDDAYRIEDLGSSNGTYVNGARLRSGEIAEGSVIQIGPKARFRFSIIDRHQESLLK